MKSSDQGIIFTIKILDPGRKCINRQYTSDYPLMYTNLNTQMEKWYARLSANLYIIPY